MNKINLMSSNLWLVVSKADIVTLRLALVLTAFTTLIWIGVMLNYGMTIDDIENGRRVMFDFIPLWLWLSCTVIYGIAEFIIVTLKIDSDYPNGQTINMLVSAFGAMLWSLNVDLLMASRIEQGVLTIIAAQWACAVIAWWIFIRDCYGR